MKNGESKLTNARLAVGISTAQLASRLGVNQSSVVRLERSEKRGAISIKSLSKAAEALGFRLHYELKEQAAAKRARSRLRPDRRSRGRRGAIGVSLRSENVSASCRLSSQERLQRALELSDFAAKLKRR